MKKINSIINITKEVLENYEKGLNILEIDEKTHEIIEKILKIKDDIKYILEIDLKDIDSITNKLNINDSEKQILKDNIHQDIYFLNQFVLMIIHKYHYFLHLVLIMF